MKNEKVKEPAGMLPQSKPMLSPWPLIRIVLIILPVLIPGPGFGGEIQTVPSPGDANEAAQTQLSSASALAAQGRKHPSYQVFASRFIAPSMVVTNGLLEIGGKQKLDSSRLDELAPDEKETLAGQFDVPPGVIENLIQSCSKQVKVDAADMAGRLRVAVIDYKYLLERWLAYQPPAGQEQVKRDALLALQSGDTGKAWAMYADLARPGPPTGLRVAN